MRNLSFKIVLAFLLSHAFVSGRTYSKESNDLVVPNIVHQIYDYHAPNYFLYLSLMTVQHFIKPDKHLLWINDAGRYRKGQWENWQNNAAAGSWEENLSKLVKAGKITPMFQAFAAHPPGNESIFVSNKAHQSDFVRMAALKEYGGIYLDTDAFPIQSLDSLRMHEFTMSFDNIINPDPTAPKRLNNGVFLCSADSEFLSKWASMYGNFDPSSWDYHSSILPFNLATKYPDLIHVEWSRLSPISYGFQTADAAAVLTCGIFNPAENSVHFPKYDFVSKSYSYEGVEPSQRFYYLMNRKLVLHLTMSAVRGICMMRKMLGGPDDLQALPSLLGHYFRLALNNGVDSYDYASLAAGSNDVKLKSWNECRQRMGMFTPPAGSQGDRQQYMD